MKDMLTYHHFVCCQSQFESKLSILLFVCVTAKFDIIIIFFVMPANHQLTISLLLGSRDDTVVRELASRQCGPDPISAGGQSYVICKTRVKTN